MDVNGQRFWMLADARHWRVGPGSHVQYDEERKSVRLAGERATINPASPPSEANAKSRVEITPQAVDGFGTRAFWDGRAEMVAAAGAGEGAVPIFIPVAGEIPSDLALGYDGVLYMAMSPAGHIIMQDRRGRWKPVKVTAVNLVAWRLAADPSGGVWVLDRTNRKLGRVEGQPLPLRPFGQYSSGTFRPCEENSNPPKLSIVIDSICPPEETPVAIACNQEGRVAILTWVREAFSHKTEFARLRLIESGSKPGSRFDLKGASLPYSLSWVTTDRVALLLENLPAEALVFQVPDDSTERLIEILPVGDMYPLKDRKREGGPFLNGISQPPRYPTDSGTALLRRLSLPSFARSGVAVNRQSIDSGSSQTVWHRIYLEAHLPANCGVKFYLSASDTPAAPSDQSAEDWHEHVFGEIFARGDQSGPPRGAWVPSESEIPFHGGLLECEPEKNVTGLFTALVQRSRRKVRTLRGRYIHVRMELSGDGRATPEIAAVRLYGSRFSYLNRYLPELYRENLFGPDADAIVSAGERSTRADFLERFLDNFEGILTPIEDRIANAYLLTDPRSVPEDAIEWLGAWIGMTFDPACPVDRRRRFIERAPNLYRRRGTLEGLTLALETATGGGVSGGEIIVIEDFRLRRTFATILGADLADEEDPLLAGIVSSGNSFVGDTLFLGEEHKKEFLALFRADAEVTARESEAVASFLDRLANRVTVLVHQEVEPQDLGLIRRIVAMETPAHVESQIVRTNSDFLVGIASLVGVDTYLSKERKSQPVRVERSHVGVRDVILRPASLDPRFEGGRYEISGASMQRPLAEAASESALLGESFVLDASESRAPEGRSIGRFVWTRID